MSELPKGWSNSTLDKMIPHDAIISDGDWVESKDQDPSGSVRLIQLADIGDGYFRNKSQRFMNEEAANRLNCSFLEKGDLLVARMPDPLGRACLFPNVGQRAVTVVDVCFVRETLLSAVSNKLLQHWFNSPYIRGLISANASGSTRKRITRKKLEKFEFPVPPLAEQKRIVEKLDEVLAQVDTIKARLDGIPALLKRFRQSVLASAVSGKLTEEWRNVNRGQSVDLLISDIESERKELKLAKQLKPSFGKHEPITYPETTLPNSWSWVCFDQISANENNALKAGPFGSALKKSDCTDSGYRVYGQEQVIAGDETLVSYYINEDKYTQLEACSVKSGDILISLVGTIGKVLILSDKVEPGIINPRLVKLSLNESIRRQYVKAYLDSPVAKQFFKGFSHGGTMEILNLGILRKLPIALPPVDEQKEIVRLVDQYFAFAETIEAQVKKAQARVDNLTQSILAKAFRGELVPQDPNDEPADKLLERIAQARKEAEALAKAAKKAQSTKSTAKKKVAKSA
ncbi:restriction endonuclease subunit S [Photobacterium damselae]|uniref:restriction endonuclease subunit S n=1 Tax=Photobacterium damselae TaxID=38293 RepID=UPI003D7D0B12